MTLSLRDGRKLRTSEAISAAALDLFASRGYDGVTVAEVAAVAGVGERTLYRYFTDKQDLLFGEDEHFRAALRDALARQPAQDRPYAVLRGASTTVATALEDRRDEVRRRRDVIAAAPPLMARERAKHAAWEAILGEALVSRAVAPAEARLLARVAVACYDEAVLRWLAPVRAQRTLADELDAVFEQVSALVT